MKSYTVMRPQDTRRLAPTAGHASAALKSLSMGWPKQAVAGKGPYFRGYLTLVSRNASRTPVFSP
eukprot:396860-Pleurochrysis_carterae.AAC.1